MTINPTYTKSEYIETEVGSATESLISEEMVTNNRLAEMAMTIAGKKLSLHHIDGPLGVRGRNSDNNLMRQKLNWEPSMRLEQGLAKTYSWINQQVRELQEAGEPA